MRKELQITLPFHYDYHNGHYYIVVRTGGGMFFPTDVAYEFMYNWFTCISGNIICKICNRLFVWPVIHQLEGQQFRFYCLVL